MNAPAKPMPNRSPPRIRKPVRVEVHENTRHWLSERGIKIAGGVGINNTVTFDDKAGKLDFTLTLDSAVRSKIVIGTGASSTARIVISGEDHQCTFAGFGAQGHNTIAVHMLGARCISHFGLDSTYVGATFLVEGGDRYLIVGEDCMFSWDVFVRNYDSHSIFEIETGEEINPPGDIHFGRHVWVGQGAMIMNGASVGDGSIVGARATVVSPIPERSLAVGTPARVVRQGVSWTRQQFAGQGDIRSVLEQLAQTPNS